MARAEEALDKLDAEHAKQLERLREQEQVLARRLREADREYGEKRRAAEEKLEGEQSRYERAMREWEEK